MKIQSYIMPIYRRKITFAIGKNLEKMTKKLNIHSQNCNYDTYNALTIRTKAKNCSHTYYVLIVQNKEIFISDLTHEASHLCTIICDDLGIIVKAWEDEAYAYMFEDTMRQLMRFLGLKDKVKISI